MKKKSGSPNFVFSSKDPETVRAMGIWKRRSFIELAHDQKFARRAFEIWLPNLHFAINRCLKEIVLMDSGPEQDTVLRIFLEVAREQGYLADVYVVLERQDFRDSDDEDDEPLLYPLQRLNRLVLAEGLNYPEVYERARRVPETGDTESVSDLLSWDPYWTKRIERYITTGDFKRAWGECKKALAGVARERKQIDQTYGVVASLGSPRRWAISREAAGRMICTLCAAMINKGLLPRATAENEDFVLKSREGVHKVYATSWVNRKRPPNYYTQNFPIAGLSVALLFVINRRQNKTSPDLLRREGRMVLAIAEHFRPKKDNSAAKAQYERWKREWDESQAKK